MMTVKPDFSRLREANISIRRSTGRPMAEILNRALMNIAYRAAEYTARADPSKIEAELVGPEKLALKIATKILMKQAGGEMVDRRGNTKLTKGGKARRYAKNVTRRMIAIRARQFIARRKKVRGYLRAGWFPAIIALGGKIRSGDVRAPLPSLGSATIATAEKLLAKITNRVYAKIGLGKKRSRAYGATQSDMKNALFRAVAKVTKENLAYAKKKLREAIQAAKSH